MGCFSRQRECKCSYPCLSLLPHNESPWTCTSDFASAYPRRERGWRGCRKRGWDPACTVATRSTPSHSLLLHLLSTLPCHLPASTCCLIFLSGQLWIRWFKQEGSALLSAMLECLLRLALTALRQSAPVEHLFHCCLAQLD